MIPRIENCSTEEFEQVKHFITAFELDDRVLKQEEFLVIKNSEGLLGFGRVREFDGFSEMCSLGIITHKRSNGLGRLLTQAMIHKAKHHIYLVCIIPHYFESFGFKVCDTYPAQIQDKLNYCTDSLVVPEDYVVMERAVWFIKQFRFFLNYSNAFMILIFFEMRLHFP